MPDAGLSAEYERARNDYGRAVRVLEPLLVRMALESVADALPGAHELEVFGGINKDWIPTLRIQRVLDDDGRVLFDVAIGHDDGTVEDLIDEVNCEYLDLLLDLTGDDYTDTKTIDFATAEPA